MTEGCNFLHMLVFSYSVFRMLSTLETLMTSEFLLQMKSGIILEILLVYTLRSLNTLLGPYYRWLVLDFFIIHLHGKTMTTM